MCLMKIFPVLKVFISSKNLSFICYARLCAGYFYIKSSPKENFPIKQKKDILTDIPLHKKARDGAIGPGDQWLAPTEEDFRSSETSN